MKSNLDCIPCFQRQALQAIRFATSDKQVQERTLRRVMEELLEQDWSNNPTKMSGLIYGIVSEISGEPDPYKELKKESNLQALELLPRMRTLVAESKDGLETAIRLSIAGNIMDFGANSHFDLEKTISECLTKEFGVNHYDKFKAALMQTSHLTYLADNAGEIVFDKLILDTILENHDIRSITFVVKGSPIINDAMMEDAMAASIDDIQGLTIVELGVGPKGADRDRSSQWFLELLADSDMIISKGQGNYEALSHRDEIFFLLMSKCHLVSQELGSKINDMILLRVR